MTGILRTPQTAGAYYRPELDALRFLAFLSVFFFHRLDYVSTDFSKHPWLFAVCNIGAFGVPVFFLLSAFLITELLLRERERSGRIHIPSFYMRRILRIWPLYFAVFFGLALLNRFVPGTGANDPRTWLAFTFFAGNWYVMVHGWIAGAVDPLWSISVEEQFYIVIPLLAALGGRRVLQWTCVLLLLGSFVTVFVYAMRHAPGDVGEWTNSFVQFQYFAAGTLLALALRGRVLHLAPRIRAAAFVLGFLCWLCASVVFRVQSWSPQPTLAGSLAGWGLVLTGTVLFFLGALGTPARWIPGPLAYCGRISYGLYLFHSLLFFLVFQKLGHWLHGAVLKTEAANSAWQIAGTVLVLALSLLAAHLSFRYFERPFLRLKERFTFVPSRKEVNPQP